MIAELGERLQELGLEAVAGDHLSELDADRPSAPVAGHSCPRLNPLPVCYGFLPATLEVEWVHFAASAGVEAAITELGLQYLRASAEAGEDLIVRLARAAELAEAGSG